MNSLLGCGLHLLLLLAPLLWMPDGVGRLRSVQVLAFLALVTLFYLAECSHAARRNSQPRFRFVAAEKMTARLALGTGVLLLAIFWTALVTGLVVQGTFAPTTSEILVALCGGLLMAGGIALRYLAMRTLGNYFVSETAVQSGQTVIHHGIYRHLRHPSETGTLLIASGAALLLLSPLALAIAIFALIPLVVVRVSLEERGLQVAFGSEYTRYMQTSQRLIPGVY